MNRQEMLETLPAWQLARHAELAGPESWLGVRGLFWLAEGTNRVGSGDDCAVRLPVGPEHLGDLRWRDGSVIWQPCHGEARALASDLLGRPDIVKHENWSFFVVDREGRLAVRLRDRAWAGEQEFAGLTYFPASTEWIVEAHWVALAEPKWMEVPNVSGDLKQVAVEFKAVFTIDGQVVELLPMSVTADGVFFVFRDRTSGRETYGAGRFLKSPSPVDGRIVLDFNRAFNPPCAFTPFATCPLPPPENWLPFPVPAGEQRWVQPA